MSDIKVGDLVIVVKNISLDKKYDKYIGRIFKVHDIFVQGDSGVTFYVIEKGITRFQNVLACREELKKIEPLDDDEEILNEKELEHVD